MRFLMVLLLSIAPGFVLAQSVASALTIDDAVSIAIRNNPKLSAAVHDVKASQSGLLSGRSLAEPSILFTPGITSLSGTGEELLISQPLELNGTRTARTGIAAARLRQTQAQSVIELRNLVFAVKTAYYELVRSQEHLALTQDLLKTAEEFDRIVRRQAELGSRPGIDQTQTEIEVLRARQQVRLAEGQKGSALAVLNTLLGREPSTPTGSLSPLSTTPHARNREALFREAQSERAEIKAEIATGDMFRQEVRLTRAQGRPDLAPQFRAGSVTRRFDDYGIGIAISLPLFDYGSRRNRVRQSEESVRAQDSRAEAAHNQVRQEVQQALERLQSAEAALREYDGGLLEKTQLLLEASRKGLEAGQTNIVAVLEAQRTFRSVQTERLNAQLAYVQAEAELERATGATPSTLLKALLGKGHNLK